MKPCIRFWNDWTGLQRRCHAVIPDEDHSKGSEAEDQRLATEYDLHVLKYPCGRQLPMDISLPACAPYE